MKSRAISLGVSVLNIFVLLLNCYGFFRQITYSRVEVIIYIVFTVIALVTSFAIGIFDYLEEKKGSGADESVLQRIVSIQNTLDGVRDEVLQANQIINGNTHKIVHNTEDDVYRYLYDWIQRGGKTVIVTRYLSWGNSTKQMSNMLKKKQKKKTLLFVFMKQKTQNFLEN